MQLDIRAVFGRGFSGKSTLVRSWLDSLAGRVVVFDPNAEPAYAAGRAAVVEDQAELVRLLLGGFDPIRIAWRGLDEDAFEQFNEACWAAGDLTMVWEEVDSWWRPGQVKPFGFRIINQGRHRNIRLIACARRPARVPRDLTANASRITAFHTTEPADLAYLRDYMGAEAGRAGTLDFARHEALDWSPQLGAKVRKSPFS